MKRLLTLLMTAGLLACPASAWASCGGETDRSGTITIEVGALTRVFVLKVPSGSDGRTPAPVLFAFHPYGMNATYMQSRVSTRLWPDAIMLYPEGFPGRGGPAWQGRPGETDDRDVAFFDAMLTWLDAHECIDRRRVFVMGYSNGAGLASVLACTRNAAIAGVAIASGRQACAPTGATPVMLAHGLRDASIGYEQAIQAAGTWSTVNRCTAPPKVETPGCFAATSCGGASTTLCTYQGGHEYNSAFSREFIEAFQKVGKKP
jgi:polyhydroxybutyrate depolymerase